MHYVRMRIHLVSSDGSAEICESCECMWGRMLWPNWMLSSLSREVGSWENDTEA